MPVGDAASAASGHPEGGESVVWSDGLLESGFGSPAVAAMLSWRRHVARMLQVETALALACADVGLVTDDDAAAVMAACDPARLDLDALAVATAGAVTPVVPMLSAVRAAWSGDHPSLVASLHRGATSQDIIDTASVLAAGEALTHLDGVLVALADRCAELADAHRQTIAPGRTLGQQAVPITFGLRAARWLGAVDRRITQLRTAAQLVAVVQLGGAAGTLAAFDGNGRAVSAALAARVGLAVPDLAWHAERDRVVELAGALAGVSTTVAGIAGAIVALASTEIGEIHPAAGTGGGSSAMPHKRNPTDAVAARAAGRLALGEIGVLLSGASDHEHERAAGAWQAEWVALRWALVRTAGAAERTLAAVRGLKVDPDRGARNLDVGLGLTGAEALVSALAVTLGRDAASHLVGELSRTAVAEGRMLGDVATDHPVMRDALPAGALDEALDPLQGLGEVDAMIDAALTTHRSLGARAPAAPGPADSIRRQAAHDEEID